MLQAPWHCAVAQPGALFASALSTDKHTLEALLTREVEDVVGGVMCRFEGVTRLGFATMEQRLERRTFSVRPL